MSHLALNLNTVAAEWKKCFKELLDPAVSEIEANGPDQFFLKRSGKREKITLGFKLSDEEYLNNIEESLVPFVNTFSTWDKNSYIFEGPLEFLLQGQRIKGRAHIVLPPAADTAQITIAKKSTSLATLESIAANGSMAKEMKDFLEAAIQARLTIVFAGATGAGKTTMLEAATKHIPMDRRIGVAEDSPELELLQNNVSYLHSVPWSPGMDPNKVATLEWCVAQFNRMRTDMLIIGETRGKEFASFLTAANSGMEGCLTTLHSTSPRRCLDKMSNFAMAGSHGQSQTSINKDIASAIDLIVQLIILPDGRHRVSSITEVTNTVNDKGSITTGELYSYNSEKDEFRKTANITDPMRRILEDRGVDTKPFFKSTPGLDIPLDMGLYAPQAASITTAKESTTPRLQSPGGGLPMPSSRSI